VLYFTLCWLYRAGTVIKNNSQDLQYNSGIKNYMAIFLVCKLAAAGLAGRLRSRQR